jgi:hypothetical protein
MTRFLAVVVLVALAGTAQANRVPSRKAEGFRTGGARGDITIPYDTNGYSTLGVWNFVGPYIYANPVVSPPRNAGVLPVFNLIYYGSKQGTSATNPGAEPRKANVLRPGKAIQ